MRNIHLWLGLITAAKGAIFVAIGLAVFGSGAFQSLGDPSLWLWFALHAVFAFASLIFFRLAARAGTASRPNNESGNG